MKKLKGAAVIVTVVIIVIAAYSFINKTTSKK